LFDFLKASSLTACHLTTPVPQATIGSAPYNPLLIKNLNLSVGIHPAGKLPTSLVNIALFGTSSDNSKIASGRYYKAANNLPWALNLPVAFEYTTGKNPIIEGYTYFPDWAQSAGVQYTDWFTNKSGYRHSPRIFQH
jgi:LruC domain-containing protein